MKYWIFLHLVSRNCQAHLHEAYKIQDVKGLKVKLRRLHALIVVRCKQHCIFSRRKLSIEHAVGHKWFVKKMLLPDVPHPRDASVLRVDSA